MTDHGARWRDLCDRVGKAWGAKMQWQLEMTTGIAGEILDRSREAEDHVWAAAVAEVLGAPAPAVRSLPRQLAAALRRHVTTARQQQVTLTQPATPEPPSTPYTRALAALLAGSCPPPVS